MPFEFIQIPANGQGSAKEELNKLLRGGRIASVRKEFVAEISMICTPTCTHTNPASRAAIQPAILFL